jgi:hypothetical protein
MKFEGVPQVPTAMTAEKGLLLYSHFNIMSIHAKKGRSKLFQVGSPQDVAYIQNFMTEIRLDTKKIDEDIQQGLHSLAKSKKQLQQQFPHYHIYIC